MKMITKCILNDIKEFRSCLSTLMDILEIAMREGFFETRSEEIEFILSKSKMVASSQSDVGFSINVTDKKNNSTLTITIYVKVGNI